MLKLLLVLLLLFFFKEKHFILLLLPTRTSLYPAPPSLPLTLPLSSPPLSLSGTREDEAE
jgi:hypothetical protein